MKIYRVLNLYLQSSKSLQRPRIICMIRGKRNWYRMPAIIIKSQITWQLLRKNCKNSTRTFASGRIRDWEPTPSGVEAVVGGGDRGIFLSEVSAGSSPVSLRRWRHCWIPLFTRIDPRLKSPNPRLKVKGTQMVPGKLKNDSTVKKTFPLDIKHPSQSGWMKLTSILSNLRRMNNKM